MFPRTFLAATLAVVLLLLAQTGFADQTTTTVDTVWTTDGITFVQTPQGLFELDYEAGVDVTDKAARYLASIAGTGQAISFTWFADQRAGQPIRVINKQGVASFAYR